MAKAKSPAFVPSLGTPLFSCVGGGASGTGRGAGSSPSTLAARWRLPFKDTVTQPVVGHDGTSYFGGTDKNVYAVSPAGEVVAKIKVDGRVVMGLALDGRGILYAPAQGRMSAVIVAIDPSRPPKECVLWKQPVDKYVGDLVPRAEGGVLVGSSSGHLVCFDAEGNSVFDVAAGEYDTAAPTELSDGSFVVSSKRSGVGIIVVGIEANGAVRYEHASKFAHGPHRAVAADGGFWLAGGGGAERWDLAGKAERQVSLGRPVVVRGAALLSDGSLVVSTSGMNGGGVARMTPSGELAWFVELPAGAGAQPLVLDGDVCVVRGLDGHLLVIAPDGSVTANIDHGQPTVADGGVPIAQAASGADGSILVRIDATGSSDAANDAKQSCEIVACG